MAVRNRFTMASGTMGTTHAQLHAFQNAEQEKEFPRKFLKAKFEMFQLRIEPGHFACQCPHAKAPNGGGGNKNKKQKRNGGFNAL